MSNVFDYLKWRGDLSFANADFGEVDGLILSMLSYIDFGLVCDGESTTLRLASQDYCPHGDYACVDYGLIIPGQNINRAFCLGGASRRMGGIVISDFLAFTDDGAGVQFAAVVYHIDDGRAAVVFRGTDDSIAGWREDLGLAYLDEIPAQRLATEFLANVAEKYPEKRFFVVGHSKGGNLALYASVNCEERVSRRIVRVYCYDGPGISRQMLESEKYRLLEGRIRVILPQSSFFGVMFEKGENYTVVKSGGVGVFQHDPFTWELDGPCFERSAALSPTGKSNEERFRRKMESMTVDERREAVEAIFSLIDSLGKKTLSEFREGGGGIALALLRNYSSLDKHKKEMIRAFLLDRDPKEI